MPDVQLTNSISSLTHASKKQVLLVPEVMIPNPSGPVHPHLRLPPSWAPDPAACPSPRCRWGGGAQGSRHQNVVHREHVTWTSRPLPPPPTPRLQAHNQKTQEVEGAWRQQISKSLSHHLNPGVCLSRTPLWACHW